MATEHPDCLLKFGDYQSKIRTGNIKNEAMKSFAVDVLTTYLKSIYPEKISMYRCAKVIGTTTLRTIDIVNEAYNRGLVRTEKTIEEKTMVWFIDKNEVNIMTLRWPNIPSRVVD